MNREDLISEVHLNSLKADFREECCGCDLNYDSDFEAIKQEVSKSDGIDYNLIEEKAYYILSQKSKDIRVFSYLALCYLRKGDWCLFSDLFEALMYLTKERFDALFPVRLQGKRMAFKWLDESRFTEMLETATVPSVAHEQMNRLISVLDNLRDSLRLNFPDSPPFPEKLHAFAKKWQKLTEQKAPEISLPVNNAESSEEHVLKDGITISASSEGCIETPKTAFDSIRKSALFLIEKEPQKAAGYRLMRVVRWANIEMLPFAEEKITKIEPPSKERRDYLVSLLEKRDYKSALAHSEKMFSSGNTLFWLDLQRISSKSAENLGIAFAGVKTAIVSETALLLDRYPQIRDLRFIDGTPFSDSETERWIEENVIPPINKRAIDNRADKQAQPGKGDKKSFIETNNDESDLVHLVDEIKRNGNELDNFRRRLSIVSHMLDAKKPEIALYMLESLYELADTYYLARWVPSMVVDLFDLMIRTYEVIAKEEIGDKKSAIIHKRDNVMKKMCYLDPGTALKYQPFDER